jgi:hypothetical protein
VGEADADGDGVGDAEGDADGEGSAGAGGSGSGGAGTAAAQTGTATVLESRVTAPFLASRRPLTEALVLAVMDVSAATVPTRVDPTPSVAELPTCQKTLHALAPPVRTTRLAEPRMRLLLD